jgi:hypothetical protein
LERVESSDVVVGGDFETKYKELMRERELTLLSLRKLELSNDSLKLDIATLREKMRAGTGGVNAASGNVGATEVCDFVKEFLLHSSLFLVNVCVCVLIYVFIGF